MKKIILKNYKVEETKYDVLGYHIIDGYDADKDELALIKTNVPKDFTWAGESVPMKIEDLKKVIEMFERNGAKYIEMMYHVDHNGYYFYGLDFEIVSSKDKRFKTILDYKDKQEKLLIKQKIKELEETKKSLQKRLK